MSHVTKAQTKPNRDAAPALKLDAESPDFAHVDHYVMVARQLRAQAIHDMFSKAYSVLFRAGKVKASAPVGHPTGHPHGGTPRAA